MNGNQIHALLLFVIPGLIAVFASKPVSRLFSRAQSSYEKQMGGVPFKAEFTSRAVMILGAGWLLAGLLMLVLWRHE
jgi:hypothetical protein